MPLPKVEKQIQEPSNKTGTQEVCALGSVLLLDLDLAKFLPHSL